LACESVFQIRKARFKRCNLQRSPLQLDVEDLANELVKLSAEFLLFRRVLRFVEPKGSLSNAHIQLPFSYHQRTHLRIAFGYLHHAQNIREDSSHTPAESVGMILVEAVHLHPKSGEPLLDEMQDFLAALLGHFLPRTRSQVVGFSKPAPVTKGAGGSAVGIGALGTLRSIEAGPAFTGNTAFS